MRCNRRKTPLAAPLKIWLPMVQSVLICNTRTRPRSAHLSKKYTVALSVAPREHSLASVLSPGALCERSLTNVFSPVAFTNVLSQTYPGERSLANVISRTFPRERSFANVFSPTFFAIILSRTFPRKRSFAYVLSSVALCQRSLTNALSIAESSFLAAAVES